MTKTTLPGWANSLLSVLGAVLVGSLLLNWIDINGVVEMSGLRIAWEDKHWLFLVPVAGGALLYCAATRSPHTRLAAVFAGLVVFGAVVFGLLRGMVNGGADSWLIFGGAAIVLAGLAPERRMLRAVGGAAVLLGFFAPWARFSLFDVLTSQLGRAMGDGLGISIRILWLIPLAALGAIASTVLAEPIGKRLALGAGIAVFGSFLYMFGSTAYAVLSWGAYAAFGASALALLVAVIASGDEPKKALPGPKPA